MAGDIRIHEKRVTDNQEQLLEILPARLVAILRKQEGLEDLIEIVMDLGRIPEARFPGRWVYLGDQPTSQEDIDHAISRVGSFSGDNRAGIERTLHRISGIRNRQGKIIGLTSRVGRAILGTVDMIRDLVESGRSILIMGRPGVGKTTKLREIARVLADELNKRVIVIDTSNEIAGDGDIPHPAIGRSRRMQVATPEAQEGVMIEAVENHMPEVIVIDEIGTEKEAYAARTIAERGVQLIGTAHGNSLENLLMNPTLSDLVGGIQSVTLSDEEARRRGTQKTILERKAPPTFDIAIELQDRDRLAIHLDVAEVVDQLLRGYVPQPEIRALDDQGKVKVLRETAYQPEDRSQRDEPDAAGRMRIYPYAVSRSQLERVIRTLRLPAVVTKNVADADVVLVLKSYARNGGQVFEQAQRKNIPVYVVKANTIPQIQKSLREVMHLDQTPGQGALTGPLPPLPDTGGPPSDALSEEEEEALQETQAAIESVLSRSEPAELNPASPKIRRIQHDMVERYNLRSESYGEEPNRRLRIFPN
ncbi:MAG: R3H domain-containing nucleic acid-binding protein [Candidatus Sericytochromatia bacterium]|nr:R3H domain-containing nucleic acid-binding protein [Candidatus Sericytochromatia bacterium]